MIKAHANEAIPAGLQVQWKDSDPDIENIYFCNYCGSISAKNLSTLLKDKSTKLSGSDWKYGWPHKFYIEFKNPEPNRLFILGTSSSPVDGWVQNTDGDYIKLGKRKTFQVKWYNSHFYDDGVPDELWEQIAHASRIRFRIRQDGRLEYIAPYGGFQVHSGLNILPPIPDWT